MNRHADLKTFYNLLEQLEKKIGGRRLLFNCNGSMNWPKKGIYFFMENGEYRSNSSDFRIIRVGTHALRINARSTLWQRLKQHKGNNQGVGENSLDTNRQPIESTVPSLNMQGAPEDEPAGVNRQPTEKENLEDHFEDLPSDKIERGHVDFGSSVSQSNVDSQQPSPTGGVKTQTAKALLVG